MENSEYLFDFTFYIGNNLDHCQLTVRATSEGDARMIAQFYLDHHGIDEHLVLKSSYDQEKVKS